MIKRIIRYIIQKLSPKLLFVIRIRKLGKYEPETDVLPFLISADELAIDVGANMGYFTYFILKHTNKILVFEPSPILVSNLRRTFGKKIKIEQVALSDQSGQATLSIPIKAGQKVFMLGTIEPENPLVKDADLNKTEVPRKKLDDYQLEKVGFIKIDVEGHELAVLRGSMELLKRDAPSLLIESEDRHKPNAIENLRIYLGELEYRGFFLLNGEIRPIEEFNLEEHQNPSITPDRTSKEEYIYVNNFIFIARDDLIQKLPKTIG